MHLSIILINTPKQSYITNDSAIDKGRRLSPVLFYAIAKTHQNNKNYTSEHFYNNLLK